MLKNFPVVTVLPATDIDRARKFYSEVLGLVEEKSDDPSGIVFSAGAGTKIYLYKRGPTKADHTVAGFKVEDLEAEMETLRAKGLRFEDYDMPQMGIKTVNGVATFGTMKAAWFKDSEGNILALDQV